MIVAERKPLDQILAMLEPYRRVLLVGCGTCTAVCLAGGEREVALLAAALRLARQARGQPLETAEVTVQRQCDREFVSPLAAPVAEADAVCSTACGCGVQLLAEVFPDRRVFPALDTRFMGVTVEPGWWAERCRGCGECILDRTGGICPVARCSKGLMNGPCGGYRDGKCEVDPQVDCAWLLIYERLKALGRLDAMGTYNPPKDWSVAFVGKPRRVVREDAKPPVVEGKV